MLIVKGLVVQKHVSHLQKRVHWKVILAWKLYS